MEKICSVYITASSIDEAKHISREILSARLAACANVFDDMTALYWWDGKQQEGKEAAVLFKTREALLPEMEKKIKELHSYDCPCIIAFPVIHVSQEYSEWVIGETCPQDPK